MTKSIAITILDMLNAYDNLHSITSEYEEKLDVSMFAENPDDELIAYLEKLWDTSYAMEIQVLGGICQKIRVATRNQIDYATAWKMVVHEREKLEKILRKAA